MFGAKRLAAFAATICLIAGSPVLAGGGQNAHNNPTGDPSDDTYQVPFANQGDGRIMVFCAENEKLVVTPVDTGAIEATCVPADD